MASMADVDGELAAALLGSKYRRRVVRTLQADGPGTPTQLGERTDLDITHVSRALGELREYDAVELLVPEATKKGRLYGLTEAGETAAEVVLDG